MRVEFVGEKVVVLLVPALSVDKTVLETPAGADDPQANVGAIRTRRANDIAIRIFMIHSP